MSCPDILELSDAFLDDELSPSDQKLVKNHLCQCVSCQRYFDRKRHLSDLVRSVPQHKVSPRFITKVSKALDMADNELETVPRTKNPLASLMSLRFSISHFLFRLAPYAFVAAITTLSVYPFAYHQAKQETYVGDILNTHIRSLASSSMVQIASRETHVLRPWFAGKLSFAPFVKNLENEGFDLVGARTDFLFGQSVAAIVYKRRAHKINLFVLPKNEAIDIAAQTVMQRGFFLECRQKGDFYLIAISDLNAQELQQFMSLIMR